jgi:hypothetical protein
MTTNDVFKTLYAIDVGPFIQSKAGRVFIEWATAWRLLKETYPQAENMIHCSASGLPFFKDDLGVFVHVSIKIDDLIVSDWYPVEKEKQNAEGIADTHQRALVKVCGRLGLGLKLWEKLGREGLDVISPEQRKILFDKSKEYGWKTEEVKSLLQTYGYETSEEIRKQDFEKIMGDIQK